MYYWCLLFEKTRLYKKHVFCTTCTSSVFSNTLFAKQRIINFLQMFVANKSNAPNFFIENRFLEEDYKMCGKKTLNLQLSV